MTPEKLAALRVWVESTLGGRIVEWRQQGGRESGGRPAWFTTVEANGQRIAGYIRADRGLTTDGRGGVAIDREFRLLQELNRAGLRVPRVFGLCDDPKAILMECVPGENDFGKIENPDRRAALARQFVKQLVKLHSLDASRFEAIGMRRPRSAEEYALGDLARWEKGHQLGLHEPVPLVTFACQWLRRNVPPAPARPVVIHGDTGPGNFLFEGDQLTAVIDWEFTHLGDPMKDLALFRPRDFYYPTGGLQWWFRLYAEISGTPLDWRKLHYYSVEAMLLTPLALGPIVQNLKPDSDHIEWLAQEVAYKRATAEVLAEAIGVALPPVPLPEFPATRYTPLFEIVKQNLATEQLPHIEDAFRSHRMRLTLRLVQHLEQAERKATAIEALELDDMGTVLGHRPPSRSDGLRELDTFVRAAGPEQDAQLLEYFYRHTVREQALLAGALGLAENAVVSPITNGDPA
jgi:aminoglycoside phosphotransferase